MNPYEEMAFLLKNNKTEKKEIFKGTMISETICKIGEIELDNKDYFMAEHLKTGYTDEKGVHIKPLKKSDVVLVLKLNDEKYIIVERLV